MKSTKTAPLLNKKGIAQRRRDVLVALQEWQHEGLMVEEIMEDTGLSEWTVRGVLDELQNTNPPLVGFRERVQDHGRPTKIYFLIANSN
jgi:predicted ArsR family transcriptional regulator